MKSNSLRLPKARLSLVIILSFLILSSIPFAVEKILDIDKAISAHAELDIPGGVFINEFMANNDAAIAGPEGDYPDWIELYNSGSESVDLSGMYLTDDLANPSAWQFPSGTIIVPNGFLVIWADNTANSGSIYADFGLNATGEEIGLFANDEETLIDSVTFGPQDDDTSFGRIPDGGSSWSFLIPTPGSPNELHETFVPNNLFINEFMASNNAAVIDSEGNYPDWIELYNSGNKSIDLGGMFLSDDLTVPKWQFPLGTTIDAGGFLVIWADSSSSDGSLHASFSLNASGEAIGLFASDGESSIDSIVFDKQISDFSYGRQPDSSSNWHYLTPTAGIANNLGDIVNTETPDDFDAVPEGLFINEIMADNQITIAGPDGSYPDWIELFNASNKTINLSGMYLTDDLADPLGWRFPNETFIEPEGFLLIWADNSSDPDSLHTSFALNANGEEVGLFARDAMTLVDSVTFLKQIGDVSYGRLPDGDENWDYLLNTTPGWGNDKRQPGAESEVWLIAMLIGIALGLSALTIVAGKVHARRKR